MKTASNRSWLRPGQPKCFHWSVQTTCILDCSWILTEQNLHSLSWWSSLLNAGHQDVFSFTIWFHLGYLFSVNGYANRKKRKGLLYLPRHPDIKAYRPRRLEPIFFFFPLRISSPFLRSISKLKRLTVQNTPKTSSMFAAHDNSWNSLYIYSYKYVSKLIWAKT